MSKKDEKGLESGVRSLEEKDLTTETTESTEKEGETGTSPLADVQAQLEASKAKVAVLAEMEASGSLERLLGQGQLSGPSFSASAEAMRERALVDGVSQYEHYYQAALGGVVGFFGLAPNVPPAVLDERAHTMAKAALASRELRHGEVRAMLAASGGEEV